MHVQICDWTQFQFLDSQLFYAKKVEKEKKTLKHLI